MKEYFILSLSWTRGEDSLCWWCPGNSGYTHYLAQAGRYSHEDVTNCASYYNNGDTTLAIPCDEVEAASAIVVPSFALRKLVPDKRFRMRTDDDEPCDACGNIRVTNLGLEVRK